MKIKVKDDVQQKGSTWAAVVVIYFYGKKNCLLDISSDHFKELVMQPNFFMLSINMWAVFQEMLLLADNKV